MQISDSSALLYEQIEKIRSNQNWSLHRKNRALFELFALVLEEATKEERLNFTTLFSRLAYAGAKFQLKTWTLHYCHVFRKGHEQDKINRNNEHLYFELGLFVCDCLLHELWNVEGGDKTMALTDEAAKYFHRSKTKTIGFKTVVEALLVEIDADNRKLYFYDDGDLSSVKTALYDVHDKNELFTQNIDSIKKNFTLPVHVNLIDVDVREDGTYLPMAFVVQPDYMVDVTAVAECFKDYGAEPVLHLASKFKPLESTVPLLIGNLVNYMLDELISTPDIPFDKLLPGMFRTNPLGFALLDDQTVKEVINSLKTHYSNLRFVVNSEFKNLHINRDNIFLEPSFYSRDYGIQGRLDLLHQRRDASEYDIIELKSGSTFKPNIYGINASHYIQTLLYDLMIKSTFHTKARSFNYILYSKEHQNALRFAPPVRTQQYEAMKLRNDIISIEQKLRYADRDNNILTYIKPQNFPKLKGFNIKGIESFYNIYSTLSNTEQSYFNHFTGFIAREQLLAKTGLHGVNSANGHAALWLESDEEKKERFALLSGLSIIENNSDDEEAFITFSRNKADSTLVNFRSGDIGVLYPAGETSNRAVLQNQIFKCSIVDLSDETVTVRLRNKQNNQRLFTEHTSWKIEQDNLDSGFNTMYKSLFLWASSAREFRSLYLGNRPPEFNKTQEAIHFDEEVTPAQAEILKRIIAAKDYYLLWGPPGTGKTSVMLKHLVKYLHENTRENILLLAYTNKAVDEMCDAIMSIGLQYKNNFLRLGSRLGTAAKFNDNLLDQVLNQASSRQEIVDLLMSKRIYVSTVSSVINRTDLFTLKSFDTVIIDEASQILEPMLAGLLPRFKRFILIGDHKQLPAVVVQDRESSTINDTNLNQDGFYDTRTSLFERLYMQIKQKEWMEAIGILEQQGRMNEQLMVFANAYFYEGKLRLLSTLPRLTANLFFKKSNEHTSFLQQNRTVFISTPEDEEFNWKTNIHEACAVTRVIKELISLYELNEMDINEDSIGIITPYRAQIALIRQQFLSLPPDISKKISVDTVERYQGGARDIIIISFCVNRISQLESLVTPSLEGIDRKLNVALTRAREQIVLIGNKALLSENQVYKDLVRAYNTKV